jgi:hypothetical protein
MNLIYTVVKISLPTHCPGEISIIKSFDNPSSAMGRKDYLEKIYINDYQSFFKVIIEQDGV